MKSDSRGTDITDMRRTYRTPVEAEFPDVLEMELNKEMDLRYGENPNQPGSIYNLGGVSLAEFTDIHMVKEGKGGMSATNFMDVTRALEILKFFEERPSVAVMKHLVPSGFATQHDNNPLEEIYVHAREADARSAYGSVVVMNRPLDACTAKEIMSAYVECVAAPDYENGTLDILGERKDIRAIQFSNLDKLPKFAGDDVEGLYDVKALPTGRVLVQKPYLSSIKGPDDLIFDPMVIRFKGKPKEERHIIERDPTPEELEDLLTAWYVNIGVRSNGVVFVKDGVTVAVGSGQQERVGAVEQAVVKAYQKDMDRQNIEYEPLNGASIYSDIVWPLEGAVMSSDAFFPYRDCIDTISRVGVTAVIQPGGSRRDYESIKAANAYGMSMVFTLERCFGHF